MTTQLYLHESGDSTAPAIVFLHGGGMSGRMWQPQWQQLSEYHCLVPDLPEHGRSAACKPFTLAGSAAEIANLIRQRVPGGKAHIVGLSIGGAVGLELMRRQPDVVNRAILSGATPKISGGLAKLIDLINLPLLKLIPRQQLTKMTLRSLGLPPSAAALVAEDLQQLNDELYRNINRSMAEVEIPRTAIPPTLLVVGEKEVGMAKKHARAIGKLTPGMTVKMVKGVGHAWSIEAPDLFNAMLRAWLTDKPLPAALQPLP